MHRTSNVLFLADTFPDEKEDDILELVSEDSEEISDIEEIDDSIYVVDNTNFTEYEDLPDYFIDLPRWA